MEFLLFYIYNFFGAEEKDIDCPRFVPLGRIFLLFISELLATDSSWGTLYSMPWSLTRYVFCCCFAWGSGESAGWTDDDLAVETDCWEDCLGFALLIRDNLHLLRVFVEGIKIFFPLDKSLAEQFVFVLWICRMFEFELQPPIINLQIFVKIIKNFL